MCNRVEDIIAVDVVGAQEVGVDSIEPATVFHAVVIGDLIDDLGHHHVKGGKCNNQSQQVEGCRQLKTACDIEEVL